MKLKKKAHFEVCDVVLSYSKIDIAEKFSDLDGKMF